jgi:hypothetical protein
LRQRKLLWRYNIVCHSQMSVEQWMKWYAASSSSVSETLAHNDEKLLDPPSKGWSVDMLPVYTQKSNDKEANIHSNTQERPLSYTTGSRLIVSVTVGRFLVCSSKSCVALFVSKLKRLLAAPVDLTLVNPKPCIWVLSKIISLGSSSDFRSLTNKLQHPSCPSAFSVLPPVYMIYLISYVSRLQVVWALCNLKKLPFFISWPKTTSCASSIIGRMHVLVESGDYKQWSTLDGLQTKFPSKALKWKSK